MTCDEARQHLLDLRRGRLSAEREREVTLHLEACAACTHAREAEEVLTELLERRLPVYPASRALKRRLADLAVEAPRPAAEIRPAPRRRWAIALAPALAAAAVIAALAFGLVQRISRPDGALAVLASEAVNDHLRVLQRTPFVQVESGGTHEVKPWFEGKLDFAPAVPPPVEPDMRLEGGALGYFVDRPAAVVVYGVRRHVVTLLIFRADGLAWPFARSSADARTPIQAGLRGYHVFLWRSGGLGYALVGDVAPAELSAIAGKLAGQT
jgi:anti-sigma factor RsiW